MRHTPVENVHGASIHRLQAQTSTAITAFAAEILILDAEHRIADCP